MKRPILRAEAQGERDKPADERPDDAQDHRGQKSHRLTAGVKHARDQTNYQAKHGPRNHCAKRSHSLSLFSKSSMTEMPESSSCKVHAAGGQTNQSRRVT